MASEDVDLGLFRGREERTDWPSSRAPGFAAMGIRTFVCRARGAVSSRPVLDVDAGRMDWRAPVERLIVSRLATQDLLHVALVDGVSRSTLAVRSHRIK